jgi:hypothetical protein
MAVITLSSRFFEAASVGAAVESHRAKVRIAYPVRDARDAADAAVYLLVERALVVLTSLVAVAADTVAR